MYCRVFCLIKSPTQITSNDAIRCTNVEVAGAASVANEALYHHHYDRNAKKMQRSVPQECHSSTIFIMVIQEEQKLGRGHDVAIY